MTQIPTTLPMELRRKYGLVHVPRIERCRLRLESTRLHLEELPSEHAGLRAAREVFPYEARELVVPEALPVSSLLDMTD